LTFLPGFRGSVDVVEQITRKNGNIFSDSFWHSAENPMALFSMVVEYQQ
jgi:hypothetical protein